LPEAKRDFVLLPRRWVVERDFAWTARFRRLARDCERLPHVLAGLHFIAFAYLMLHRLIPVLLVHNTLRYNSSTYPELGRCGIRICPPLSDPDGFTGRSMRRLNS
jgi:hypothetical protein